MLLNVYLKYPYSIGSALKGSGNAKLLILQGLPRWTQRPTQGCIPPMRMSLI